MNKEALSLLFASYAPILLGLITKPDKDQALAEVVHQKSFLMVICQLSNFKEDKGNLFFWMITTIGGMAIYA